MSNKLTAYLAGNSHTFLMQRMAVAGMAYIGTLILADFAGVENYGGIAYLIFLIKVIPVFTIGLNQGLIYYIYEEETTQYFFNYIIAYIAIVAVVLLCYRVFFGPMHALLGILLSVVFLLEPFLKTKKYFLVMLYPECILILSFLIAELLKRAEFHEFNSDWIVILVCLFLLSAFLKSYLPAAIPSAMKSFKKSNLNFYSILKMIKRGIASSLFGLFFVLFLFLDRNLVSELHGPNNLSVVMLSYQIALISGFVITTFNVTSVVDIGEKSKLNNLEVYNYIKKRYFNMLFLGFLFYFLTIALVLILRSFIFLEYDDLTVFVSIVGFSLVFFNGYSSVSSILLFKRKLLIPTLYLGVVCPVVYLSHTFLASLKFSLIAIELVSFSIFTMAIVLSSVYLFKICKEDV